MLGGTYKHSIDEKGRMVVPAKYKTILGDVFVITAGIVDDTLMIMSMPEWDKFFARYSSLPLSKTQETRARFNGNQYDVSFDKQGRMQIPQQLRELINLGEEVVIVGKGEFAEIRNATSSAELVKPAKSAFDEMAELGI